MFPKIWNLNFNVLEWKCWFWYLDFKCFTSDLGFWRCAFQLNLLEMEIFGVWNSSVLLRIWMAVLMFAVQKRC